MGPILFIDISNVALTYEAERSHRALSKKLGSATLKISIMIYERNLKYLGDNGTFVLPERYKYKIGIKTTKAEKTVAYAAPLIPIFKLKIKIGSRIRFKILDPIINAVGVLEFPSACNVSENRLLKIKRYAKTMIGTNSQKSKYMSFQHPHKTKLHLQTKRVIQ